MKSISLALALMAASTAAMANTGTIQFKGKITDATCPIEVIDPISGGNGSMIQLGNFSKDYFTGANARTPARSFQLWIKDGTACGFVPGDEVDVTFTGLDGADTDYYLTKQGADAAKGIAVALRDRTSTDVKPGTPSAKYPVVDDGETFLNFSAAMAATTATVTAGSVDADVMFVVNLP